MWPVTLATATAGEMPRKISSGVMRNPPPDDARELARGSAVRRAHSTDVRRARHACAHFLLCRTRHGKLEVGQGCGWRGSVDAAALDHRPGTAPAVPRGLIRPVVSGRGLGAHAGTRTPVADAAMAADGG